MGKRPEDLPLDDTPLVRTQPTDVREAEWYQFCQRLDELIESGHYSWASDTLTGIRDSVERYKVVTPGQRSAVDNVEAARGRSDGWRRRYEGFGRGRR